jgi:hypothetical protein
MIRFHSEDGGSMVLRNVGIAPQHYTLSQSRTPEDGINIVLRNVGILPQHYTASQPRGPRKPAVRIAVNGISKRIITNRPGGRR